MRHPMNLIALLSAAVSALPAAAAGENFNAHRSLDVVTLGNPVIKQTERVFFDTRREALSREFEESSNYVSLNGTWDFRYYLSEKEFLADPDKEPVSIDVPCSYERQGFGDAVYVNQPYDFAPSDPQPPTLPDAIPVAVYSRNFTPKFSHGDRCYLNIGGAKGGMYVYVDKKFVGYTEDAKNLVRYDLTDFVKAGSASRVAIVLTKWSTGSYLECQDFWRLNGIERDVFLSYEPEGVPADLDWEIVSTLEDDLKTGHFKLKVLSSVPVTMGWSLLDSRGRTVLYSESQLFSGSITTEKKIRNVHKWSAENPELYNLIIDVNGKYLRAEVGFRRLEIKGSVFYVNGEPVKFKGVNLHEHNEYTGHYVTRQDILKDLELLRKANINAIRTCHYPQPRAFYELCDRLGFYVYDEANIESHGMGYSPDKTLAEKPEWYAKHIDRVENMYYRTRNYPCVTILSLGNEAGNGQNFKKCYDVVKAREAAGQNRPVVYERAWGSYNTDMHVPMYCKTKWLKSEGENGSPKPDIQCEYTHAMGNSNGSLDLMWEQINKYDNLQGGFIWDWVDQGLRETDDQGRVYWTYGGDYGVNSPSDGNFNCNGVVGPDRIPHPAYTQIRYCYQNISVSHKGGKEFQILNRNYFVDLSQYETEWTVTADGLELASGSFRSKAGPQECQLFTLDYPELPKDKRCCITFTTRTRAAQPLLEAGSIVAQDQILLSDAKREPYSPDTSVTRTKKQGNLLILSDDRAELVFDKSKGILVSYKFDGEELFDSEFGLRPNFWRGPTDNDYGNKWPMRTQAFKTSSRQFNANARFDGDAIVAQYKLASGNTFTVRFTLGGSVLGVRYSFAGVAAKEAVEVPRIGFRMRLPASADRFSYFGRGPEENYNDRSSGIPEGIYSSSASEEFVPYVRPQECGHHTGCRYLQIGDLTVRGEGFEFNALRQSVEDLDGEEARHRDYQWHNFSPDEVHDPAAAANKLRRQTHVNDIVDRDFVEVCIDGGHTGIGGYDSWGARTEPAYCLWSDKSYDYSFSIVPTALMSASKSMRYSF